MDRPLRTEAVEPGDVPASSVPPIVERYAIQSTGVLHQIVDVACNVGELTHTVTDQVDMLGDVREKMRDLDNANHRISAHAAQSIETAEATGTEIANSVATIRSAVCRLGELLQAIGTGRDLLLSLKDILSTVEGGLRGIDRVSKEIHLLSLNASMEAARVGEAGRGFSVVAKEVKSLAEQSSKATKDVTSAIKQIERQCHLMIGQSDETTAMADAVGASTSGVSARLDAVEKSVRRVVDSTVDISVATRAIGERSVALTKLFDELSEGFDQSETNVRRIDERVRELQLACETLVETNVESGIRTDDTVFVSEAIALAALVSEALASAIARGALTVDDMFDRNYIAVPGTNPEQFRTRYVDLLDDIIMPILDRAVSFDPRVVVCAIADENGYVPTINSKYALRPKLDPAWNAANCRNRRFFKDRVGQSAGSNKRPYLIQTYLRDMGGGRFSPMAHIASPITVSSRHWGNVRYAYSLNHQEKK